MMRLLAGEEASDKALRPCKESCLKKNTDLVIFHISTIKFWGCFQLFFKPLANCYTLFAPDVHQNGCPSSEYINKKSLLTLPSFKIKTCISFLRSQTVWPSLLMNSHTGKGFSFPVHFKTAKNGSASLTDLGEIEAFRQVFKLLIWHRFLNFCSSSMKTSSASFPSKPTCFVFCCCCFWLQRHC